MRDGPIQALAVKLCGDRNELFAKCLAYRPPNTHKPALLFDERIDVGPVNIEGFGSQGRWDGAVKRRGNAFLIGSLMTEWNGPATPRTESPWLQLDMGEDLFAGRSRRYLNAVSKADVLVEEDGLTRRYIPCQWEWEITVFLHALTTPDGQTRLVRVAFYPPCFVVGDPSPFETTVLASPIGFLPMKRITQRGGIAIACPPPIPLRLFMGHADPSDASHFDIPFSTGDKPGVIDGWLQNDGAVRYRIRGGAS